MCGASDEPQRAGGAPTAAGRRERVASLDRRRLDAQLVEKRVAVVGVVDGGVDGSGGVVVVGGGVDGEATLGDAAGS